MVCRANYFYKKSQIFSFFFQFYLFYLLHLFFASYYRSKDLTKQSERSRFIPDTSSFVSEIKNDSKIDVSFFEFFKTFGNQFKASIQYIQLCS